MVVLNKRPLIRISSLKAVNTVSIAIHRLLVDYPEKIWLSSSWQMHVPTTPVASSFSRRLGLCFGSYFPPPYQSLQGRKAVIYMAKVFEHI